MGPSVSMTWTSSQRTQILDDYWQNGASVCPVCGLTIVPHPDDSNELVLRVSCINGCDRFSLEREQDPLYSKFRPWTEQEALAILERLPAFCPIDGAKLEITATNGQHVARCVRCGNSAAKPLSTSRKQPRNRSS